MDGKLTFEAAANPPGAVLKAEIRITSMANFDAVPTVIYPYCMILIWSQ